MTVGAPFLASFARRGDFDLGVGLPQLYGTESVMFWLFASLPDVAVTVTV